MQTHTQRPPRRRQLIEDSSLVIHSWQRVVMVVVLVMVTVVVLVVVMVLVT